MKQTSIIYYASDKIKYFYKGKEISRYYIETKKEQISTIGEPGCLAGLVEPLCKFYSKNSSKIELINCTNDLKERGFRPLNDLENKVLLSTLKQESQQ
jgi:hypothetical protein